MSIATTFQTLAALPAEVRIACHAQALAERDEALQVAACRALLDRRAEPRRADLVLDHFADLLPAARAELVPHLEEFLRLARERIVATRERRRLPAYRLVAELAGMAGCELLALGVGDEVPEVVETVLGALEVQHTALLALWRAAPADLDTPSPSALGEEAARAWTSLGVVLRAFASHQRTGFLDTLLAFGPVALPHVGSLVQNKDASVAKALVQRAAASTDPGVAELLAAMLLEKDHAVQHAAARALRVPRRGEAALAYARRLAACQDERGLAAVRALRDPVWLQTIAAALPELEAGAARRLLALLRGSAIDGRRRQTLAECFLAHADHRVAIEAVELLQQLGCPQGFRAIERVLAQAALPVRTAATRLVLALDPPEKFVLLAPLLGLPDAELRTIAVRELSHGSFGRYFERFSAMSSEARQIAARALAKIDDQLLVRVAEEVASLDAERRLKALQIVGFLRAGKQLEGPLHELLDDPDRRVRATAVRVLQIAGSAAAHEALLQALADPDRRIRANAIEAFAQLDDPRFVELLLPFLHDRDNRVRGNACRALWQLGRPEAADALRAMLVDPDEAMRLSGVWALGEMDLPDARELLAARELAEVSAKVLARIRDVLATRGKEVAP